MESKYIDILIETICSRVNDYVFDFSSCGYFTIDPGIDGVVVFKKWFVTGKIEIDHFNDYISTDSCEQLQQHLNSLVHSKLNSKARDLFGEKFSNRLIFEIESFVHTTPDPSNFIPEIRYKLNIDCKFHVDECEKDFSEFYNTSRASSPETRKRFYSEFFKKDKKETRPRPKVPNFADKLASANKAFDYWASRSTDSSYWSTILNGMVNNKLVKDDVF